MQVFSNPTGQSFLRGRRLKFDLLQRGDNAACRLHSAEIVVAVIVDNVGADYAERLYGNFGGKGKIFVDVVAYVDNFAQLHAEISGENFKTLGRRLCKSL